MYDYESGRKINAACHVCGLSDGTKHRTFLDCVARLREIVGFLDSAVAYLRRH